MRITIFCLLISTIALGQTIPTPRPTPPTTEEEEVVKISTSLIQVDVIVTDTNGNQITDLKADDFEIYENDEKQTINGISYKSTKNSNNLNADGNISVNAGKSSNTVASPPRVGEVRRTVAIVVDDLRIPLDSLNYVKKALTKFVTEQIGVKDLVAIIRTSKSVGVLQQFTTDKQKLLEIVQNLQFKPSNSGLGAFAPMEITFSEKIKENIAITLEAIAKQTAVEEDKDPMTSGKQAIEKVEKIGDATKLNNLVRNELLSSGTLNVLNATISGMKSLPGRKSVLFIAPGLDSTSINTEAAQSNKGNTLSSITRNAQVDSVLQAITENANRSSVSIYSLDPRGSQPINLSASDNTREGMMTSKTREDIQNEVNSNKNDFLESQSPLKFFAHETGGKAFINTNDLEKGLRDTLDAQNGYYLLAYQPDSDTFDPTKRRFNRLTVKVKRPNVKVSYRSGFFNTAETEKTPETSNRTFIQRLFSPYIYDEVRVKVAAVYAGNEQTSVVRSFVGIEAEDLNFIEGKNGEKTAKFDLMATAFDENSLPVTLIGKTFELKVNPKTYEQIKASGIVCNLSFAPQIIGRHQIKIAVRDLSTERIGTAVQTIEVLNLNAKPFGLSGILLQNYSFEEWKKMLSGKPTLNAADSNAKMQNDSARRRFKRETVLSFAQAVYVSAKQNSNLQTWTTLFKDSIEIFKGHPEEINFQPTGKTQIISQKGAIVLPSTLVAGKYVLKVSVANPATKNQVESQSIDFEIVE